MTDRKTLHNVIKSYGELPDNWNHNGAKGFSSKLIGRCHYILDRLLYIPFISPTACDSIQFEFDNNRGSYFEFEVYDDKIKLYSVIAGVEYYDELPCDGSIFELNDLILKINKRVQKLYE